MEFITAEQLQEQPMEVQKVFLDWWKPSIGDLVNIVMVNAYGEERNEVTLIDYEVMGYANDTVEDDSEWTVKDWIMEYVSNIPLFTEGQLRKFIEDKLEQKHYENDGRKIKLDITHNNNFTCIEEGVYGSIKGVKRVEWIIENEFGKRYDLLQAYWKVACEVAKEGEECNDYMGFRFYQNITKRQCNSFNCKRGYHK